MLKSQLKNNDKQVADGKILIKNLFDKKIENEYFTLHPSFTFKAGALKGQAKKLDQMPSWSNIRPADECQDKDFIDLRSDSSEAKVNTEDIIYAVRWKPKGIEWLLKKESINDVEVRSIAINGSDCIVNIDEAHSKPMVTEMSTIISQFRSSKETIKKAVITIVTNNLKMLKHAVPILMRKEADGKIHIYETEKCSLFIFGFSKFNRFEASDVVMHRYPFNIQHDNESCATLSVLTLKNADLIMSCAQTSAPLSSCSDLSDIDCKTPPDLIKYTQSANVNNILEKNHLNESSDTGRQLKAGIREVDLLDKFPTKTDSRGPYIFNQPLDGNFCYREKEYSGHKILMYKSNKQINTNLAVYALSMAKQLATDKLITQDVELILNNIDQSLSNLGQVEIKNLKTKPNRVEFPGNNILKVESGRSNLGKTNTKQPEYKDSDRKTKKIDVAEEDVNDRIGRSTFSVERNPQDRSKHIPSIHTMLKDFESTNLQDSQSSYMRIEEIESSTSEDEDRQPLTFDEIFRAGKEQVKSLTTEIDLLLNKLKQVDPEGHERQLSYLSKLVSAGEKKAIEIAEAYSKKTTASRVNEAIADYKNTMNREIIPAFKEVRLGIQKALIAKEKADNKRQLPQERQELRVHKDDKAEMQRQQAKKQIAKSKQTVEPKKVDIKKSTVAQEKPEEEKTEGVNKPEDKKSNETLYIMIAVILALVVCGAAYMYSRNPSTSNNLNNANGQSKLSI